MGIIDRISQGLKGAKDWWDDDTVMFSRKQLKNIQKNVENEEIKEQIVDAALSGDMKRAEELESQRDAEAYATAESIRNTSSMISEQQRNMNAAKEIIYNKREINKQAMAREMSRQEMINRTISEESFSFYKVKELLVKGVNLQDALTAAGCMEDCEYQLDYSGRTFIRLNDKACDNVCSSIYQNLRVERLLERKDAVMISLGMRGETSFSFGLLVYDKDFGFILLKKDKYSETVVNDFADGLLHSGYLDDRLGFGKIALCKTFVKVAAPCAICINADSGIETEEDRNMLMQMQEYSDEVSMRFSRAIDYLKIRI